MQLLEESHSALTVHSGRQFGGEPKKSGIHEQDTSPLLSLHIELLPQGFGTQGFCGVGAEIKKRLLICINVILIVECKYN